MSKLSLELLVKMSRTVLNSGHHFSRDMLETYIGKAEGFLKSRKKNTQANATLVEGIKRAKEFIQQLENTAK